MPRSAEKSALTAVTLHCPHCGNEAAAISVKLAQLDCECFSCDDCGTEFSLESVEQLIARWQAVIAWVKSVPQFDAE